MAKKIHKKNDKLNKNNEIKDIDIETSDARLDNDDDIDDDDGYIDDNSANIINNDKFGNEFNPKLHSSKTEFTPKGKWKKISKNATKQTKKDTHTQKPSTATASATSAQDTAESVLLLIEDLCNAYIAPATEKEKDNFKITRNPLLDSVFKDKFTSYIDKKGDGLGDFMDKVFSDKIVLLGVPLFYAIKAASANQTKTQKIIESIKKAKYAFSFFPQWVKRKFKKRKTTQEGDSA